MSNHGVSSFKWWATTGDWASYGCQAAAKGVLEKLFNLGDCREQRLHKLAEFWLLGAMLDEALQDTAAIDVRRDLQRMRRQLLKDECTRGRGQELHVLLQDKVCMQMLAEFQCLPLQFTREGLLKLWRGFFQCCLHHPATPTIFREPQQRSLQAPGHRWDRRTPVVSRFPARDEQVADDASAIGMAGQIGELWQK